MAESQTKSNGLSPVRSHVLHPGMEVAGAVVVQRSTNGILMRCECQCTFVTDPRKIREAQKAGERLGCPYCAAQWRKAKGKPTRTREETRKCGKKREPSPNVREAFRLRAERGICNNAIADILGVTPQTVDMYFLRWAGRMGE